ncbi:hypothetical protein GRW41_25195, partial [Escherichia coli]|nr:hypothetical protein [Escherichia coli]
MPFYFRKECPLNSGYLSGQAHRAGLWVIKTGLLETQTVDFTLGSQGLRHTPGDIIEIC